MNFKDFLESKGWFEGYPGTRENPPTKGAWVSPETITRNTHQSGMLGDIGLPVNKKPVRLGRDELAKLPPHLRNDDDVVASTWSSSTRKNPKTGRIRDTKGAYRHDKFQL